MVQHPEQLRALIDALDEPAMVVDDWIVALANPAARDLLGETIERRDVRLAIRHPQALDLILTRSVGEIFLTGIGDPGRAWRLIIKALDRRSVLVRMIERTSLVSAERMRVDFVANASHELRTPLATIIGYAETLADGADIPQELRATFAGTIGGEARRMLRIIEDLMSLSRIEADRFVAPTELVVPEDLIAAAQFDSRLLLEQCRCRLDVDVEAELPPVRGDSGQLVQVLDNLIGNAARYGCQRPESVIRVSAARDQDFIKFQVADSGPGVAKEHLPRLTERFYRVDPARSRESGGTGLGLAIVKHIVERHRGTLDISSEPGAGTAVSFRIPVDH